jgi:hypothetical protein
MDRRRYDDDEVAEILALATSDGNTSGAAQPTAAAGLTLEELRSIAADVGIAPARIDEATRALERRGSVPAPSTLLGAPRSVARTVPLQRGLDDEEWERLVADLRATFGAVGEVTTHGALRSWSNGNLQAHVEPDGDGWRLRMQSLKEDAAPLAMMAGAVSLIGLSIFVVALVDGSAAREMVVSLVFMAGGFGKLGYLRVSLPRWADERAAQMESVAERLQHRLAAPALESPRPGAEATS